MVRVLFVCLGNICRSPMAEAVFHHKVKEAGLEDYIEVDSAGTGDWHIGERPHSGTRRLLASKAIKYDHCARQIRNRDLNDFDYIITMDDDNYHTVKHMGKGPAAIEPMMSYAPQLGISEVPDPWYTGNFEAVYEMLDVAADGLLKTIRERYSL